MPVDAMLIKQHLQNSFPDAEISLTDLVGDQNHYSLVIKAVEFRDKTLLQQHKMVNIALKELLAEKLHAIQIQTAVKEA